MPGSERPAPAGRTTARPAWRGPFPAGLLAGVLPAGVAVVDALDESFDGTRLLDRPERGRDVAFAAEIDALGDAAPRRRLEFARARICAHAAVAMLGELPEPILFGSQREPRWPAGLVGSITHCPGYRAAAVAQAVEVLAVGVDAEPDLPLPAGVSGLAFPDTDRAGSGRLARFRNWERVAFSARESVFKAWFAVTGCWLDFADATMHLRPDGPGGGDFTATIGPDVAGVQQLIDACGSAELHGRFRWVATPASRPAPNLVLTAVTLPHRDASAATGRRSSPTVDHR